MQRCQIGEGSKIANPLAFIAPYSLWHTYSKSAKNSGAETLYSSPEDSDSSALPVEQNSLLPRNAKEVKVKCSNNNKLTNANAMRLLTIAIFEYRLPN